MFPAGRPDIERAYGAGAFPDFVEFGLVNFVDPEKGTRFRLLGRRDGSNEFEHIKVVLSKRRLKQMTGRDG